MKITNPPETKQIITCPTEREKPLHHFSGPSHAPAVSTAHTLHGRWLRSDFFLFLCSHFCLRLSFPFLFSGRAVTFCIFSAIVTKWKSSPAAPYFWRSVLNIPGISETWGVHAEEGGTEDETWGDLTNQSIWPIQAVQAEEQGLVSFFSVLQLLQRSDYFRSFFWIHNVLTPLALLNMNHNICQHFWCTSSLPLRKLVTVWISSYRRVFGFMSWQTRL